MRILTLKEMEDPGDSFFIENLFTNRMADLLRERIDAPLMPMFRRIRMFAGLAQIRQERRVQAAMIAERRRI